MPLIIAVPAIATLFCAQRSQMFVWCLPFVSVYGSSYGEIWSRVAHGRISRVCNRHRASRQTTRTGRAGSHDFTASFHRESTASRRMTTRRVSALARRREHVYRLIVRLAAPLQMLAIKMRDRPECYWPSLAETLVPLLQAESSEGRGGPSLAW